ncbi:hypothetical protein N7495_004554 [Penicillium taxi]|uniref:uncharacterized protein n=1 Tax=Penicillium taxi TaxID=168475 RepID=UPI00254557F9|nr:uncharacterized protein N7495_004554 [Penicillium taxi]KAJ5899810.1 hypothetical protein N7495_004554 [Penicillium taxi]
MVGFATRPSRTGMRGLTTSPTTFAKDVSMKDWKGDHGLPISVQAEAKNAFPPWLIGSTYAQLPARRVYAGEEVETFNLEISEPSPSNENMLQAGSFLDIFTRHLSHYAQEQMRNGVIPVDEMFQQESRELMYNCEDRWNETITDDPD